MQCLVKTLENAMLSCDGVDIFILSVPFGVEQFASSRWANKLAELGVEEKIELELPFY